MAANFDILSTEISKGGQNAFLTELAVLRTVTARLDGAHKLRIEIRTDSYKDQGYATVERWDGAAWREVYRIQPTAMRSDAKLAYKGDRREAIARADFLLDLETLYARAAQVLS